MDIEVGYSIAVIAVVSVYNSAPSFSFSGFWRKEDCAESSTISGGGSAGIHYGSIGSVLLEKY